jgi:mono/diheme cytochrome c family protein
VNGNPSYIMTAQSTAISMRKVSQINPRVIIFTPPLTRGRLMGAPRPNPSYVAMGFARGDQHVELLAKDPATGSIRFFLLKYEQACNTAPGGCTPGDLFTAASESKFVGWSLYDDQDLKNTTLDCLQCHEPNGPGTGRMLRMQELQRPWQHWMYNDSLGITQMRGDFHAAHGTSESYGGIPAAAFDAGDVQQLEAFVENNGFLSQPNEFAGAAIAAELQAGASSATWQALYAGSENGRFIPVPHFGPVATDPVKVQALINQYTAVAAGTLPRAQLGDLGDVFTDAAQRAMTHKPALGLDGKQLLVQVCQECHNSRLDQTISRASFNIEKLAQLPRAEKDEAIRRINTPKAACEHMPPERFRELDAAEIALIQAELQK